MVVKAVTLSNSRTAAQSFELRSHLAGTIYAQVFLLSARYTLSNKLSARLSVRVENHLCWLRHSFTRSAGDKRRAATLGVLAEPVGGLPPIKSVSRGSGAKPPRKNGFSRFLLPKCTVRNSTQIVANANEIGEQFTEKRADKLVCEP